MKKLMLTATVVALAGATFAANYGNIFDYKASVKYVDFKKISAKTDSDAKANILIKTVKCATLTGYLVTPQCCPCQDADTAKNGPCQRFGMAPSFLVLQNKASKKYNQDYGLSKVKIMPANLLTEWWSTESMVRAINNGKDLTLQAQGYLFAGVGKRDVPDPKASPFYGLGDRGLENAFDPFKRKTAATQFLFGYYNVVDATEGKYDFIEPFLDHAGFGKAKLSCTEGSIITGAPCVIPGVNPDTHSICLQSLSGTLIGGSFDCALNGALAVKDGSYWAAVGTAWTDCEDYICQGWDDHTENAQSTGSVNYLDQLHQPFNNAGMYNVVCGTWSIKANTKIGNGVNHIQDVAIVAQKIDSNFLLGTFDTPQTVRGQKISGLDGAFYWKWMAYWNTAD